MHAVALGQHPSASVPIDDVYFASDGGSFASNLSCLAPAASV